MKKVLLLMLLFSTAAFSQTFVDLSNLTEDIVLGQNCSQSQTPQEFVTNNIGMNGYKITLKNSNLKIDGFINNTGGEIATCGQSTFCPSYSMDNNFVFNIEDMDCSNGNIADDCPISFTEPGQLYFSSSVPLVLSSDFVEINSGNNYSYYDFAGSYIQTQGSVPVSWTYYFNLSSGVDWNLQDSFTFDFINVEQTCVFGQQETLSIERLEKDKLRDYNIENNSLNVPLANKVSLYDITGKFIKQGIKDINLNYLAKGMYIVHASNKDSTVSFKIIIK